MKKIIVALIVLFSGSTLSAQSVIDSIFARFSEAKDADYVNLDSTDNDSIKQTGLVAMQLTFKGLTALQVLDLEDCEQATKDEFRAIEIEENEQYKTLLKTKDEDGITHILICQQGDAITEFIVIDYSDPTIVRMKGIFKKEDLDKLMDQ